MVESKEMHLIGGVKVPVDAPSFVFPVFGMEDSMAGPFLQVPNERGKISGFVVTHLPAGSLIEIPLEISCKIGDPALYGFQFSPEETLLGVKEEIQDELRSRYSSFANDPFLSFEIAEFLEDEEKIVWAKNTLIKIYGSKIIFHDKYTTILP